MMDSPASSFVDLKQGEAAPWFHAASLKGAPQFAFHTVAGRHILMLFFGSANVQKAANALRLMRAKRSLFDDEKASFFGVTVDPLDEREARIEPVLPGVRYFLDYDAAVSRLYGAVGGAPGSAKLAYRPFWLILDPTLRIVARYSLEQGPQALTALESAIATPFVPDWAPVLMVPDILDRQLCAEMIDLYRQSGGEESGFMREVDGKTVLMTDPQHKQRRDCSIEDPSLRARLGHAVTRRLLPMVKRAFQFDATRMERYIVGCYDADGGHFRPHRDNTTRGTAHRRFAVTINLNAENYDGGDLRFPEYGSRTYRAPTGGAIVFSCGLLHEATPVTRGTRYAFLPFLYDESAAQLREANNHYLGPQLGAYSREVLG